VAGRLYLVPNLLGVVPPSDVLPARTLDVARGLSHWIVETPKAARAFLKSPEATPAAVAAALAALKEGGDVGLLSDAGCPGVADPGAAVVAAAHAAHLAVVPLVGPSAVLLALMASGMNGQHFSFHGYLPVKPDARADALRALERTSRAEARTELFIETPYRNAAMLQALSTALKRSTRVCVAADLTLGTETIDCRTAGEWRGADFGRFERRPAIFLLQAPGK
jgi:16S rRNA (cytidine1402-2'-O)-methyltransferase